MTADTTIFPTGFKLLEETTGSGDCLRHGERAIVLLNAWLTSGEPIQEATVVETLLGKGTLIPGVEESLVGMRRGGRRLMRIPPSHAYGESGVPERIPPNASLIYEIEVLETWPDLKLEAGGE